MKLISHRGNIKGKIIDKENRPSYIDAAIGIGYEVEVDIRFIKNKIWLGHDEAQYEINLNWLLKRKNNLWLHCKDLESSLFLYNHKSDLKYFCHTNDSYVLTSDGCVWVHDLSLALNEKCIIPLLSENEVKEHEKYKNVYGICTDFVNLIKSK